MISPTTTTQVTQAAQLPSLVQNALSGISTSAVASPFGVGGGFPAVGTFQGIGSQAFSLPTTIPTATTATGLPQTFTVGGPVQNGIPVGGGQFPGFVQTTPSIPTTGLTSSVPSTAQLLSSALVPAPSPVPTTTGLLPTATAGTAGVVTNPPLGTVGTAASPLLGSAGTAGTVNPLLATAGTTKPLTATAGTAGSVLPAASLASVTGTAGSAGTTGIAGTATTSAQMSGMVQQMVIAILATVFQALMETMKGSATAGTTQSPSPTPAAATTTTTATAAAAPAPAASAANLTLQNTTANSSQKSQLDQSLAAIAQDPDGAKLLAAAKAKGVTISAGDPATAGGANDIAIPCNCAACQAAAADAAAGLSANPTSIAADAGNAGNAGNSSGVIVNGVTLSNAQGNNIRIVVRDPSNIKTIVHELVHAVSTGDGNSKEEEGIADVVGSRVANRLGGAAVGGLNGSDQQIFQNKQLLYPTLQQNNNIRNTLASDGINVSV